MGEPEPPSTTMSQALTDSTVDTAATPDTVTLDTEPDTTPDTVTVPETPDTVTTPDTDMVVTTPDTVSADIKQRRHQCQTHVIVAEMIRIIIGQASKKRTKSSLHSDILCHVTSASNIESNNY